VSKPTKLLSFARTSGRGALQPESEHAEEVMIPPDPASETSLTKNLVAPTAGVKKKTNRVATNLRLTRDQWRRVHELALDEETTVQELAIRGLSLLFEKQGLLRL